MVAHPRHRGPFRQRILLERFRSEVARSFQGHISRIQTTRFFPRRVSFVLILPCKSFCSLRCQLAPNKALKPTVPPPAGPRLSFGVSDQKHGALRPYPRSVLCTLSTLS